VPKAFSGRASGMNGQISTDHNSDTADFGVGSFHPTTANSFENIQFYEDSPVTVQTSSPVTFHSY
jgi:hypothetical protein